MSEYYCEYCQEQELKEYLINSLGDVFCSKHCKEQMQQFYKGNYKIVEKKIDKILSKKEARQ